MSQTLDELERMTKGCRNPLHFPPPWRNPLYTIEQTAEWRARPLGVARLVHFRKHICSGCGQKFEYSVPVEEK